MPRYIRLAFPLSANSLATRILIFLFSVPSLKDEILTEFPRLLVEDERGKLRQTYELVKRRSEFGVGGSSNGVTESSNGSCLSPLSTADPPNALLAPLEEYICRAGSAELRDSAEILVKLSCPAFNAIILPW